MPARPKPGSFTAYLSSTWIDLEEEREAVHHALRDECVVKHSYRASERELVSSCLDDVSACDFYIGIFGLRYGHVPEKGVPNPDELSIVEMEYRRAVQDRKPRLIFIKHEDAVPYPKTDAKTKEHLPERIDEFRQRLATEQRAVFFFTLDDLKLEVVKAFNAFKETHGDDPGTDADHAKPRTNDSIRAGYLDWLREECEKVVLLGMNARERQNVRLGEIYVPAVTHHREQDDPESRRDRPEQRYDLLLHRLAAESLYVPGAAGAGKSTFCRWLALCITQGEPPNHTIPAPDDFQEALSPDLTGMFPLYCRLREWSNDPNANHLEGNGQWRQKRLEDSLAAWLDATQPGGLTGTAFREVLNGGKCLLILDGVDEVPEAIGVHRPRSNFLTGLADALPRWRKSGNRVLLTSRPYGVDSAQKQLLRLAEADIVGLPDELQELFVWRWYAASGSSDAAIKAEGLLEHLGRRADLAELRLNPMLLTALCVKYDEGQRLPGDIYLLYDSVVDQVLYKRFETEHERNLARRRLEAVALCMHRGTERNPRSSPAAEVAFDEIDQALADFARTDSTTESGGVEIVARRELLLSNSGLLLPSGEKSANFYHLSFQEFLAAERLRALQISPKNLIEAHAANPNWRRTLTFLFAALAESRPEHALTEFASLQQYLRPEAVKQDARPALLMTSCLELGHARKWNLDAFAAPLREACDAMLDSDDLSARADLWATLGTLGFDHRKGVGLNQDGSPDISWCKIPRGQVELEEGAGQFEVSEFHMSKYPITYAQYRAFLFDPEGYAQERWWRDMPHDPTPGTQAWPIDNQPAENVSWYDAVAFCRWFSARSGSEVRLPTEWEWQQAAMSASAGYHYPWGVDWRERAANTRDCSLGRTTAVGIFPQGSSLQAVSDLAGNVWEWCLNKRDAPRQLEIDSTNDWRVVRGGYWHDSPDYARAASRNGYHPYFRFSFIGFRVVCVSPIS